jgi:hypothetical protein
VLVVVLAACGRVGFDATAERVTDAPLDDATPGDALAIPGLLASFSFDDDPTDGVENRALGGGLATCLSSCPTRVQGVHGNAYLLNGTTDVIRYPDRASLHTQSGTLAMWIRIVQLPALNEYQVLASKPFGTGTQDSWEIFLYQGTSLVVTGGGDSAANSMYVQRDWTPTVGTWAHVALTWGSQIRVYVDGALLGETADPGRSYDGGDVFIGADFNTGGIIARVNGAIDDVYLFSEELSAAQIALLATP